MAKCTVLVKVLQDDGSIQEWQGSMDLETEGLGNTKGLMERIRLLVRRELIRRSLLVATDEDRTRIR